jgi:hypothetical protein
MPKSGIKPRRCGTCKSFPGNGKKCSKNTRHNMLVYANDYGKGHCGNYHEKED